MKRFLVLLCLTFALSTTDSTAQTLRWSSAGDVLTFDAHAAADTFSRNVSGQIYETLVTRAKDTSIEPALAVSWQVVDPLRWRLRIREGVKFHDGSLLTADDVVFSVNRSQHANASNRALAVRLGRAKKIDTYAVEFELDTPNPVFLEHLMVAEVMNKTWAERHGVVRPQAYGDREETYAVRNANGTGPYMLKSYEAGVRTVLVRNPSYWQKVEGNIDQAIYRPITNPATRIAALVSGELDFVLDPPPQDIDRLKTTPALKIVEGIEWRVLQLGFDQYREELLYSNVKGRNPFKDRRVRLAFYHAIDVDALRTKVMRGAAQPTGSIAFDPRTAGPEIEARLAYDPAAARRLIAEAGFPEGFEVRLDCPNNRYINDEKICVAISAMLAQIGIKAPVHAQPMAMFSPRLDTRDVSFFLLGFGGGGRDPQTALSLLAHSENAQTGDGRFNSGRFSDPEIDRLVAAMKTEMDTKRRDEMIRQSLLKMREGVYVIPLHRQMLPWAMRRGVQVVHTPWNALRLQWVRVD